MKIGKSKQRLRMDWQRNELIRNLEAIFKEGSKLYPLMDEKEVCDKIQTLPPHKAPKNRAELLMVMKANHERNEKWVNENPEPVTPVEDGETLIEPTFDHGVPGDLTKNGTIWGSVAGTTKSSTHGAFVDSWKDTLTSEKNLSNGDGNSLQKEPDSGSGTPS
jgi:hypothetical protein